MPWFIKTERFTNQTLSMPPEERKLFLAQHKSWILKLNSLGKKVISGYLVNENKLPGGGGLLILEANSYEEAKSLIQEDPMIVYDLVSWTLQEWVPVSAELPSEIT